MKHADWLPYFLSNSLLFSPTDETDMGGIVRRVQRRAQGAEACGGVRRGSKQ